LERRAGVDAAVKRLAAPSALAAGLALRAHPFGRRGDLAALLRHSWIGVPRE